MHPSRILEVHSAIGATGRLPGRFYLGVLVRGTDVGWLSSTLATAGIEADDVEEVLEVAGVRVDGPQEEAAEWLAWTRGATDVIDPTRRGRWMAMGVSRRMIVLLDQYLIAPDDIETLARGVGRDPDGAARQLAGWLEAGLRPPVDDLVRLHQEGTRPALVRPLPRRRQPPARASSGSPRCARPTPTSRSSSRSPAPCPTR